MEALEELPGWLTSRKHTHVEPSMALGGPQKVPAALWVASLGLCLPPWGSSRLLQGAPLLQKSIKTTFDFH